MVILLAAVLLTQVQHDAVEREYYRRLAAQQDYVVEIWPRRPKALLGDLGKARRCYTRFHLDRVAGCDAELDQVDKDIQVERLRHTNELEDLERLQP